MSAHLRVVLVSREVRPFVGGGIGRYVAESAALLAEHGAEVTILTSARFAERAAPGSDAVRWAWAEEPEGDLTPLWSQQHAWSVSCFRALRELCLTEAPDVVEFPDYGGAAKTTLDAVRTADPAFARTQVVVRAHTTWELTQAFDGLPVDDLHGRMVVALERDALRFADRLLVPSGRTLDAYRAHYGEALAPAVEAPVAMRLAPLAPGAREAPEGPLRLLYVGRFQRMKGVAELVGAMRRVERDDVTLTLVGDDTATAPGGGSMREHVERLAGGDGRIELRDAVAPEALSSLIREHDACVVPSRFEAFGYVAREALAENRPVLGAATGGIAEVVEPGRSGRLLDEPSEDALHAALTELAADPAGVREAIAAGAPRAVLEQRNRPDAHVAAYREVAAKPPARCGPATRAASPGGIAADRAPLVTAVITCVAGDGPLERTLDSLAAQAGARLELVVAAADGVLVPARLLARVHALALLDSRNATVADVRRAGLARRAGRGPVLLIRSGQTVAPGFVARCAAALAADGDLAFVTAHADGRARGSAPLGNHAAQFVPDEPAAATVALLRADALADLERPFAALAAGGRYGAVVPEPLVGHWRPD